MAIFVLHLFYGYMLNNLNPTVAYRINYSDNSLTQAQDAYDMPIGEDVQVYDTLEHCTYLTDFSNSDFIEGYLQSRGINFVKIPENEALSEKALIKRAVLPIEYQNDGKHSVVLLNTEKFEKYYRNDDCYLKYDTDDFQFKNVLNYLKSGEDFEVPQADVYEAGGKLNISFNDGRHRYATLRELGFKYVPICLDENSIEAAKKYGLLN